jgi:ABC-2 type transport system permease protein
MRHLPNILTVARREFVVRARTRSFRLGTAALLVAVAAVAFVPVILAVVQGGGTTRVAVWVQPGDLAVDPAPTLQGLLDQTPGTGAATRYTVTAATDLASARAQVVDGTVDEVLGIARGADGDLVFTLYTKDPTTRTAQLIGQACTSVAVGDRLIRAGIDPSSAAGLFAPAAFSVAFADPARTDTPKSGAEAGAEYLLGFGMTILIFMMIILYGQWVAMSVVDEKSSRVMEVILNAATPFELLAGKVAGVGALALTQFVAIVVVGIGAIAAQGPVAEKLLGQAGAALEAPQGLTPELLVLLAVFGVLGFLLYAALYAAFGSLASRQEDLQQAIMPMAMLSTVGYLIATYSATGLLDIRAEWTAILAQVPFFSPFMMLPRISSGTASGGEIVLSIAILVVSIVVAIWFAARVYGVGVLLYGQRPGLRRVLHLLRRGL